MIDKIRKLVEPISKNFCACDDDPTFTPDNYAGGNIDDAHERGLEDGRILLARTIVELLNGGE